MDSSFPFIHHRILFISYRFTGVAALQISRQTESSVRSDSFHLRVPEKLTSSARADSRSERDAPAF